MIRMATNDDAPFMVDIYNYYIEHSTATFEEEKLTVDDLIKRMQKVRNSGFTWLVAEDKGEVIGYAYSTNWNERCCFPLSLANDSSHYTEVIGG